MKCYRKVLIAVNGSKNVLIQGLKVADEEKCWVTVIKVVPPNEGDLSLVGVGNIDDVLDGGGSKAISEIKEIGKADGTYVKTRLEQGEIYKRILEAAQEENCDLIIMGRHRRSGLRRLFGDNVVKRVIDEAPCPVLVVRS